MVRRRIPRARTRADFWIKQIQAADSGTDALDIAIRWVKSEIATVSEQRAADAENLCWDTAFTFALTAASVPGATADSRPHELQDSEVRQLRNPWGPEAQGEGARK